MFPRILAVAVLLSCGVSPIEKPVDALKVEAQAAIDDVSNALLSGDVEAFRAQYAGEGADDAHALEILMESQANGIRSHYDGVPQVVDARTEPDGEVSVSLFASKLGMMSPKRVYFTRDSSGHLRWSGVHVPGSSGNQVRQAIYSCTGPDGLPYKCHDYDVYNLETSQLHALRGQSEMILVPDGCQSGGSSCWQTSAFPWYASVAAGFQAYKPLVCKVWNTTQCAVNMMTPTYSDCTCSGTAVTKASGWCAYIHAFGWDFGWNNGAGGINVLPSIGAAASCP